MTEPHPARRRQVLAAVAALPLAPWSTLARAAQPRTVVAAWQDQAQQHLGLLQLQAQGLHELHRVALPTRAHGLQVLADGSVLAAARRPGDWLLRWHPERALQHWAWVEPERRLNGHLLACGERLWSSETELEAGQGLLGLRHALSLEKTEEWPTHGRDPHQVLALPQPLAGLPPGALLVANGGIPTLPETGRSKLWVHEMASSLVALHPQHGALLGQWQLSERYLSLRHLAWNPHSQLLGVALQAEHPDPQARATAPVLAVWNGRELRTAPPHTPLQGYGGDICALPDGGFLVSCPRAHALARFSATGTLTHTHELKAACALFSDATGWACAGAALASTAPHRTSAEPTPLALPPQAHWQLDNHWLPLSTALGTPTPAQR
ncbi:DUF1513 domain-containing protein [Roseateles sp. BYS180W]|uniref:DUF1513 domain-containing protein n=1 Tax=Roseateles rivi TaxID=3299028 RepID=A0ABW7FZ41_9BURK